MRFSLSRISLRTRLIVLTTLALIALLIAMLSAYRTARMSAAFAERRTEINVQAAARELARQAENIGKMPSDRQGNVPPHVREIERRYADDYSRAAAIALDRFAEVSGGFCAADGAVRGFVKGTDTSTDLPQIEICRPAANAADLKTVTMPINGENFYVVVAPAANGKAGDVAGVFAYEKLPRNDVLADRFNLVTQIFLLLSSVALAGFALTTFRRWRSGMTKIESGLHEISIDLSRRIESPKIAELERISREINRLAENLQTNLAKQTELEKDLAQSEKLAALGRMASGAAHEIRNPLAAMKLKIQLAERSKFDTEKLEKTFAVLSEEIKRLDNIVKKLLDASRPAKLNFSRIKLNDLLETRLTMIAEKAAANSVEIKFETNNNIREIAADAEKLTQVFDNLLNNALEAMPDGGVLRVNVSTARGKLIVEIADTGAGVDDGDTARLFEPFYTTKEKGTGLGLAISREIVEAHGGKIYFKSERGRGAAFFIELPRAADN